MIVINKSTADVNHKHVATCDGCESTVTTSTLLSFGNGVEVILCENCVRELTKELTSNKYLNADSYQNKICKK